MLLKISDRHLRENTENNKNAFPETHHSIGGIMRDFTVSKATDLYTKATTGNQSVATVKIYFHSIKYLIEFFGPDTDINDIQSYEAELFRAFLISQKRYSKSAYHKNKQTGKPLAISTVRRFLGCSKSIFRWLHLHKLIESNPFESVQLPTERKSEPRAMSKEDFQKLLEEAERGTNTTRPFEEAYRARETAILLFFGSTGCRVSGIASAQISTLRFDGSEAKIRISEKSQGGPKDRTAYLSETAAIALLLWLDHRPDTPSHDFLFTGLEGVYRGDRLEVSAYPLILRRLGKRVNRRAKKCGLIEPINSPIHPHAIRHLCAIEWLRNGLSLPEVARLLGNSEEVVMKYYSHFSDHEIRERHAAKSWVEN